MQRFELEDSFNSVFSWENLARAAQKREKHFLYCKPTPNRKKSKK
jgi:hypothetical protein